MLQGASSAAGAAAIAAAFDRIAAVQARLSRFDAGSEIARFNDAPQGAVIEVGADAGGVLAAARALRDASGGIFDVSLGTGIDAWQCEGNALAKLSGTVRIDLGGIGKGYAV
ncbi:MAG: FAD:protein FMN transferase, partial [Pseudomonadota bacterium]|nr:FAD:protein FMN transferase [Pseudomonadota bacterium]